MLRRHYAAGGPPVRLIAAAMVLAAGLLYLPTLQPDVSASRDPYLRDVGNVQNALSQWGTLHGSAYPLYSLSGAAFVALARAFGLEPALAAGLYSTVWATATLLMLYAFLSDWLDDRLAAIVMAAVVGVGWVFWLHASIAEVYAPGTFVIAAALWLANRAARAERPAYLYGLAVCCGMAVAHHRALVLALPSALLIAAPAFIQISRRRPLFVARWIGLVVLSAVLPYLYLLVRVLQGATWLWGDLTTPAGFWRQMFGEAYSALISWPTTGEGWLSLLTQIAQTTLDILTWPVVMLGAMGMAGLLVRRQWRFGAALLLGALLPAMLAVSVQTTFNGQVIEDVPALLQMSAIFIVCGAAYGLAQVRRRWAAPGIVAAAIVGGLCGWLIAQNRPAVYALTHDTRGREVIATTRRFLDEARLPEPPAFFALWGGDYWALAYARDVTGELAGFDLLPNRADVAAAVSAYGRVYTFEWTFYLRGLEWWDRKLGRAFLSSAAPGVVAISTQPIWTETGAPAEVGAASMGESIQLRAWQAQPMAEAGAWHITLYWQARSSPERDYSIFVHATDRDAIDGADDIVAQADASAPVYGRYPTTRWSPGEIVRDDYIVQGSPDRKARRVSVGMYYQDETGAFHNLGEQYILLP